MSKRTAAQQGAPGFQSNESSSSLFIHLSKKRQPKENKGMLLQQRTTHNCQKQQRTFILTYLKNILQDKNHHVVIVSKRAKKKVSSQPLKTCFVFWVERQDPKSVHLQQESFSNTSSQPPKHKHTTQVMFSYAKTIPVRMSLLLLSRFKFFDLCAE